MTIYWLTTMPNPRARNSGYDAGQRGWKLHAVESKSDSFKETRWTRALCGVLPAHGWGLDMFIEDECKRCLRRLDDLKVSD